MRFRRTALACAAAAFALAVPLPPAHAGDCGGLPKHSVIPVVDDAHVIEPEPLAYLAADLMRYQISGHQAIVAATVRTLGGDDIASYARRLFDCWGVGGADEDNGVLILVAMKERRARIELGAGLSGQVDQERLDLILESMVTPLRKGDVGGALRGAAVEVAHDLGGELPDTKNDHGITPGGTDTGANGAATDVTDLTRDLPGSVTAPPAGLGPFGGSGDSGGTHLAALVPVLVTAGLIAMVVRALFRGGLGAGGGGSSWRGGFPAYGWHGGPGWGSAALLRGGTWHDGGSSGGSTGGSSGPSGSYWSGGSSGGGGSFGGGSGGGAGASGSW